MGPRKCHKARGLPQCSALSTPPGPFPVITDVLRRYWQFPTGGSPVFQSVVLESPDFQSVFVLEYLFKDFYLVHSLGRGPSEHTVKDSRSLSSEVLSCDTSHCMGRHHRVLFVSPMKAGAWGCKKLPIWPRVIKAFVSPSGVSGLCQHPRRCGRLTC